MQLDSWLARSGDRAAVGPRSADGSALGSSRQVTETGVFWQRALSLFCSRASISSKGCHNQFGESAADCSAGFVGSALTSPATANCCRNAGLINKARMSVAAIP
jgi:hypothetical protein